MGGIIHFTRSWMPCALALALSSTPAKSQSSNDTPGRTPIQIGLLRLRPSGFLESTGVLRSAASGDDMSTRFGSIPLESSGGESLVSFRNSRMALLGEVPLSEALKVSGYAEADFLNRPPNDPFRWRQYYGKLQWGDWEVLAGQAWSLLRPNRLRISSEGDLMNTRVVDAGYHVGLLGSRRRQVRVTRRMGAWQAGISVENGKDFLPKLVHDGKRTHLELIGLAGRGGRRGMSIAAVAHATSKLDLVTQQFYSSGGGPDALSTIPAGIRVLSTLEGAEMKLRKGLEVFAYGGLVYGRPSPGNRAVREWTTGFSQKVLVDRYGSAVFAAQYSQIDRSTWAGQHGMMNTVMLSMRHYFGVQ